MNEEDIKLLCRLYREAKDKETQIKILAQLFAIPIYKVEDILEANGLIGNNKTKIYEKFRKLYKCGLTDYEIAIESKQKIADVRDWRILNCIKPNIHRKGV